jgi:hypothetical protein
MGFKPAMWTKAVRALCIQLICLRELLYYVMLCYVCYVMGDIMTGDTKPEKTKELINKLNQTILLFVGLLNLTFSAPCLILCLVIG